VPHCCDIEHGACSHAGVQTWGACIHCAAHFVACWIDLCCHLAPPWRHMVHGAGAEHRSASLNDASQPVRCLHVPCAMPRQLLLAGSRCCSAARMHWAVSAAAQLPCYPALPATLLYLLHDSLLPCSLLPCSLLPCSLLPCSLLPCSLLPCCPAHLLCCPRMALDQEVQCCHELVLQAGRRMVCQHQHVAVSYRHIAP
jgi:hypothetical protein